jgi:chemotaxis family two-component system response regulator Rcp1
LWQENFSYLGCGRIPVVILTSSEAETDILKIYSLYANAYITKPADLDHFIKIMNSIEDFWFRAVTLPPA